ncbi:MAG: glycosyltransferase, partial [bacterium]|nr:glycosyltransferase [bacterium]
MISFITPTLWQRPEFMLQAEQSLADQTYKNIEWIIISDKPQTIKLKNSVKTTVIIDKNATNVSKARNLGILKSTKEYIAFLDDDNLKRKDFGEKMLPVAAEKHCLFCFSNLMKDNKIIGTHHLSTIDYNKAFELGNFYFTEEMFIQKDFLLKMGMFDENLPMSEDYDLAFRLMQKAIIEVVPHHLSTIRQHDGQLIKTDVVSTTQDCMHKILDKHNRLGNN